MHDALVYGTEIAVGSACLIGGVVVAKRREWLVVGILALLGLSAVGHAVYAWFIASG